MKINFRNFAAFLVCVVLLSSQIVSAQTDRPASNTNSQTPTSANFRMPRIPVEQFTLPNGLRVVMSRDARVPVVSVAMYVDVGSRSEREGRSGFAHLFEHMLYQGSQNVPKGVYDSTIQRAGGSSNGSTSSERTNYFVTVPANQLPVVLWLESDRLRALDVSQENLDNQRAVVQEERRFRVDNVPYAPASLRINELLFRNRQNANSTIGSMEDLNAATLQDVREFFATYYVPNNTVLSIVGDFDPAEARRLVERYFGTIPRGRNPIPPVNVAEPSDEVAQRTDRMQDNFARFPAFRFAWKIPARRTPDFYALTIARTILAGGESSRLYQRLVKGDESVLSIQSFIDERRGPSAFHIFALPKPDRDAGQVRQVILDEIRRLATETPSNDEMEKARNIIINQAVRSIQSSLARAQRLAEFMVYDNDPNLINTEIENYLRVTPAQVRAAVARFLNTDNRVLLEIVPAARGGARPAAAQPQTSPAPATGEPRPTAPPQQTPPTRPVAPTAQPSPSPANPTRPTQP
jgi:zinc protease